MKKNITAHYTQNFKKPNNYSVSPSVRLSFNHILDFDTRSARFEGSNVVETDKKVRGTRFLVRRRTDL